jgi:alpha-1,2-mannosyltransferase
MQLKIFKAMIDDKDYHLPDDTTFVMIGTVRGPDDQILVNDLKKLAFELGINTRIRFEINKPRLVLMELFAKSKVALHTMEYEHFGIAVVELITSGMMTIAHNSAGPKEDIIGGCKEPVGFLAETADQYKTLALNCFKNYETEHFIEMRKRGRTWVYDRFGVQAFETLFVEHISTLL